MKKTIFKADLSYIYTWPVSFLVDVFVFSFFSFHIYLKKFRV